MKQIAVVTLCLCLSCVVAAEPESRALPASPADLIEILKTHGERYTVDLPEVGFVKDSDLPYLVELLDSEEPCAFVDLSISSIRFPGKSTVGHEAAYLIEGFWKRYYPTQLTSQQFKPDTKEMKRWYSQWSRLKKKSTKSAEAVDGFPTDNTTPRLISVHEIQTPGLVTGLLEHRLGTRMVVTGVRSERVKMSNPLAVSEVDGRQLRKPVSIEINGNIKIEKGLVYHLEGYESGQYEGYPHWAMPGAQRPLYFHSVFVVTKVIEPASDRPQE